MSLALAGTLLALSSLSSGCAVLQSLGLGTKADRGSDEAQTAGPLANATCEAHWRAYPEAPLSDPEASAEAKVVDSLCWPMARNDPREGAMDAQRTRQRLGADDRPYVQAHFAFDDRHVDPLQASLIVTGCVDHGTCEARRSYVVGQMVPYAEAVTPQSVQQAVARLDLDPSVRDAYVEHYTAARATVLSLADQMPEKDVAVCLDLPQQIRERRAGDYETLADHYAQFDALWPRLRGVMDNEAGDAALLAEAVALRDATVAACYERTALEPLQCWHATPARPLTEAVFRMAIRQGDTPRARVEQETLKSAPDQFMVGNEISFAQSKQLSPSGSYTAWDRRPTIAYDGTLDAAVRSMGGEVDGVVAEVEGIQRSGDEATIRLKTQVEKKTHHICKETDKIDRVKNGKVYYKQKCREGKTETIRTAFEPVTVPAADVARLETGALVNVVIDPKTRRGHVLEVVSSLKAGFNGKRPRVQFRSTPLKRPS